MRQKKVEHYGRVMSTFLMARSDDEQSILSLAGSLDGESTPSFYEATSGIISKLHPGSRLELVLDDLESISSTGVGAVARLFAEAAGRDITMYIASMSPACATVFSVLGLGSYVSLPGSESS